MKKIIVLVCALIMCMSSFAQWVSPGNGTTYTISSIADLAKDVITDLNDGHFKIHQDITISAKDTLNLDSTVKVIDVDDGINIEISGALMTEEGNRILMNGGFQLFFNEANSTTISGITFSGLKQVLLSKTNQRFKNCHFEYCTNAGINFMNCNPVIENCGFHHNEKAAITSAVNCQGSPVIRSCNFFCNDFSKANIPQINLGPGSTDTIIIENNIIDGAAAYMNSMSGGIGIMNMGLGNTIILVKGNDILHNRYGYTQNGSNIKAIITDNNIHNNKKETNPNNGGSGISIYGNDTTCTAIIRRNIISDNLWGVTAIYHHNIDLGTVEDPGENVFYNNANGGVEYELYNNALDDISAIGNYWGSNDSSKVEDVIFHANDSAGYGLVTYNPIMMLEPQILAFDFLKENNPTLEKDCIGVFENDGEYDITIDIGLWDMSELIPTIKVPLGETCYPGSLIPQNFKDHSVLYTVSTPHGTQRDYKVRVFYEVSVPEHDNFSVSLYPNPTTTDNFTILNNSEDCISVDVYSITGQLMYSGKCSESQMIVNTGDWSSGVYAVRIQQNNKIKIKKLVVR